jgi:hypothetical protein
MLPDSGIRGCPSYTLESLGVTESACVSTCVSKGATACEWYQSTGECYSYQGGGCFVQAGFPGWKAGVLTGGVCTPPYPTPPVALVGDLNNDKIVNSLDWSIMNSKWFTTDPVADLNKDGLVNAIDFSLLNVNWFKTIP